MCLVVMEQTSILDPSNLRRPRHGRAGVWGSRVGSTVAVADVLRLDLLFEVPRTPHTTGEMITRHATCNVNLFTVASTLTSERKCFCQSPPCCYAVKVAYKQTTIDRNFP